MVADRKVQAAFGALGPHLQGTVRTYSSQTLGSRRKFSLCSLPPPPGEILRHPCLFDFSPFLRNCVP